MNTPLATMLEFYLLAAFLPLAAILLLKWPQNWQQILAVFVGLLIAFIDQQANGVHLTVLLLLAFGLLLGFGDPAHPWRLVLIIASWIPLAQMLRLLIERRFGSFLSEGLASFFALVPASAGAFVGVKIRSLAARVRRQGG